LYRHAPPDYECPFCAVVRGEDTPWTKQSDVVYRDATVTAWVNSKWWENNPGGVVVVPNRHVENIYELDRDLGASTHDMARRIALAMKHAFACDGVSTRQHNEPAGDQEVWHYHLHVFPRFAADDLYGSRARLTTAEEREPYAAALRSALPGVDPDWEKLEPADAAALLADLPIRWWIAGGWALDLLEGRQTRPHKDVDVAVLRSEHEALRSHLADWDLQIAHRGVLRPWIDGPVGPPENAVWARPDVDGLWLLDFKIEDDVDGYWLYRRDPTLRRPVAEIGAVVDGIPCLAADIVRLYASGR
jgi:histidine triad (HIT) family protein